MPPSNEHLLRRAGGSYFRIERVLGSGAMGSVFLVRDPNLADRRRVVKVLHEEQALSSRAVERFQREARAMARLHHPHIAGVEDIGLLEPQAGARPLPYYVMPWVDGESLRAILKRRTRLSPAEVLDLGVQAASALEAIHDAGVIHCDVKPDNLVVARASGALVLIDFGVMHLEVEGERSGFYGTFAYASDHQVAGNTPRRDDDLFSLSMVLYELACGVRPFAELGSGSEAARARAGKHARPLRKHGVEHPLLESVLEAGIDPDPTKRWTDAAAMKRALEHVRKLFGDAPADARQAATREGAPKKITPTDLADPTVAGAARAPAPLAATVESEGVRREAAKPTLPTVQVEKAAPAIDPEADKPTRKLTPIEAPIAPPIALPIAPRVAALPFVPAKPEYRNRHAQFLFPPRAFPPLRPVAAPAPPKRGIRDVVLAAVSIAMLAVSLVVAALILRGPGKSASSSANDANDANAPSSANGASKAAVPGPRPGSGL
jgi:serine/threonine-protein kinase